jgi:hypothetical protein
MSIDIDNRRTIQGTVEYNSHAGLKNEIDSLITQQINDEINKKNTKTLSDIGDRLSDTIENMRTLTNAEAVITFINHIDDLILRKITGISTEDYLKNIALLKEYKRQNLESRYEINAIQIRTLIKSVYSEIEKFKDIRQKIRNLYKYEKILHFLHNNSYHIENGILVYQSSSRGGKRKSRRNRKSKKSRKTRRRRRR